MRVTLDREIKLIAVVLFSRFFSDRQSFSWPLTEDIPNLVVDKCTVGPTNVDANKDAEMPQVAEVVATALHQSRSFPSESIYRYYATSRSFSSFALFSLPVRSELIAEKTSLGASTRLRNSRRPTSSASGSSLPRWRCLALWPAAATIARDSATVFAWKGETLSEYWWCTERCLDWGADGGPDLIVDDGGDATAEFQIMVGIIRDGIKTDPQKYHRMKERLVGVSEETTTGVKRLYQMQANGTFCSLQSTSTIPSSRAR
ncbi:hypothetical protein ZIOFF_054310 [Zingiber officinale]|uniref:Adenosylhomocysteinase n=1 Tax=Zingiber officinale TaxID=94328 RepID=A0A8J5FET5_ZINOF|nr:hypothetical protein ZIOFF_054310 [Zingiber officinale]